MNHFVPLLSLALFFPSLLFLDARAAPYFEVGTSIGTVKNGDSYFNLTSVSGSSFVGSFNFYVPITPLRHFTHLDLGLQNRLTTFTTGSGQSLALETTGLGLRLEFWRFYAGAGYSPLAFTSSPGSGVLGLKSKSGASGYFGEAGVIWRVVPELQITLSYGLEYCTPKGGGTNLTSTEYGLHFRFPLHPKENSSKSEVKFDGFRYPFGFMK